MLEEFPDEFLRRVTAAEHSFLRRSFKEPAAARRCVVLFDAGIAQLGAPRLAHLATAIVLAARAEAHCATFEWGVLQNLETTLASGLTQASVRALLRGRTAAVCTSLDVDRWAAHVQPARVELARASELWLVGSDDMVGHARRHGALAVTVAEVLDPALPRRLRVATARGAERVREAVLALPEHRLAVPLLRDPFASAVVAMTTAAMAVDASSNLVFAPDGRRLFIRGVDATLIAFHVPNSPRGTVGVPSVFALPVGHTAIAVGRSQQRRQIVVVSQVDNELTVHMLSKRGKTATHALRHHPSGFVLPPILPSSRLCSLAVLSNGSLCFITAAGDLVELTRGVVLLRDAAASPDSRALNDSLVYLRQRNSPQIMWAKADAMGFTAHPAGIQTSLRLALGERDFVFGRGVSELFASRSSPTAWTIVQSHRSTDMEVPPGCRVVGVVPRGDDGASLVVVDESKTRVCTVQKRGPPLLLLTTSAPIQHVAVGPEGNIVAAVTATAEVCAFSLTANAMVVRSAPAPAPIMATSRRTRS
ncbi:MAG: hypothetical protein Q8O67_32055 [Deltaproteobacteria bacterium]|nr:hypothetical protein [Deltaproteobacteria bacterium]